VVTKQYGFKQHGHEYSQVANCRRYEATVFLTSHRAWGTGFCMH